MRLYRPVGLNELRFIYGTDMAEFPPRLPDQPIFYPVLNLDYAGQTARDWNTKRDPFAGHVAEFEIDDSYASRFEPRQVGGKQHLEFWVPAEALDVFNGHIQTPISVPAAYFGDAFVGEFPDGSIPEDRSERYDLLESLTSDNEQLFDRFDIAFYELAGRYLAGLLKLVTTHKAEFVILSRVTAQA